MAWHETQNEKFLQIILSRMNGPVLTWVAQFIDILTPFLKPGTTLNDIGCNVGQFYKGLKEKELIVNYHGFDLEPLYLAEARKLFPEIKGKFHVLDIQKQSPPLADISVISATLEHLEELSPGLDNLLSSTTKIVLVRTFLGEIAKKDFISKKGSHRPYVINQYSFVEILNTFAKHDFTATLIRDRYTDSLPKFISSETIPIEGIVRTQYIILGHKT